MYLSQIDFLKAIYTRHTHVVKTYENIRFKLLQNKVEGKKLDVNSLFMKCYNCHQKGHIAIDCPFFDEI